MASRRCVPYPVTTTGSRIAAAGGILCAEWDRPEQASDQRGSEVTDNFHTSVPSTVGVEVPLSLEFSSYPSPERGVVKDPHFASYPAYSPRWYTFPLYCWSAWMPTLDV